MSNLVLVSRKQTWMKKTMECRLREEGEMAQTDEQSTSDGIGLELEAHH